MRRRHAAYDDEVFAWDEPPEGGHPGEAFNCRCYAEPSKQHIGEPKIAFSLVEGALVFGLGALIIIAAHERAINNQRTRLSLPPISVFSPDGEAPAEAEGEEDEAVPDSETSPMSPNPEDGDEEPPEDEDEQRRKKALA